MRILKKAKALIIMILFVCILIPCDFACAEKLSNPRLDKDNHTVTYDCVYFGNYWQEDMNGDGKADKKDRKTPIKWRVLSVNGNDAFLIADRNLDIQRYNDTHVDVTWETCTMRSWLNGYGAVSNICGQDYTGTGSSFINNAFSTSEKNAIQNTVLSNKDNPNHGTEGGKDTTDKIFLLSLEDIANESYGFTNYRNKTGESDCDWGNGDPVDKVYYGKGVNDYYCIADYAKLRANTNYAKGNTTTGTSGIGTGWWWLRSPGCGSDCALDVSCNGYVSCLSYYVVSGSMAVCPALHLNLAYSDVWSKAGTVTCKPGSSNSETNGDYKITSAIDVPKDKNIIYVIDDSTYELIPNAIIKIADKYYNTGSKGWFECDEKEMCFNITAYADGYADREWRDYAIDINKSYVLSMIPATDKPTVYSAIMYDKADKEWANSTRNILSQKFTIEEGSKNTYCIEITSGYTGGVKYYDLIQGGEVVARSENGKFEVSIDDFHLSEKVYIRIIGKDNVKGVPEETGIVIFDRAVYDDSDFELKLADKIQVTIPAEIPILGGQEINLDFDKIPINSEETPKTNCWVVSCDGDKCTLGGQYKRKTKLGDTELQCIFKVQAEGSMDKLVGTIQVIISGKAEAEGYVPSTPILLTLEVEGKLDSKISGTINLKANNVSASYVIEPSFSIDMGAGTGLKKALTVTVNGKAELKTTYKGVIADLADRNQNSAVMKLTLQAYIKAKALWYTHKINIAKKTWTLYDSTARTSSYNLSDDLMAAENYVPYVATMSTSIWSESDSATYATKLNDNITLTQLQKNVYEGINPQIVQSDTITMMIYENCNAALTVNNQMELMYSVFDNVSKTWTEPKKVEGDGKSDSQPVAISDGKDIYLAWVNEKEELTEDADLTEAASMCEIEIAKYDEVSDAFVITKITDNDSMDVMPCITFSNNDIELLWIGNSENNIFLNEDDDTIYHATIDKETLDVRKQQEIFTGKNIQEFDVGVLDSKLCVVYLTDEDGDYMTTEDCIISIYDVAAEQSRVIAEDNASSIQYSDKDNSFTWIRSGQLYSLSSLTGNASQLLPADCPVGVGYHIIENDDTKTVLFGELFSQENDSANTGLMAYTYNKNAKTWGKKTNLYYNNDIVKCVSGFYDDDNLVLLTAEGVGEGTGEDYEETLSLNMVEIAAASDIQFYAIDAGNIKVVDGSNKVDAVLSLYNNGQIAATGYTVTLEKNGETIDTINFADMIQSGEVKEQPVEFSLSENVGRETEFIVRVSSSGDCNVSNNTQSFITGYTDLELTMTENIINDDYIANIVVNNLSEYPAEATLKIYKESVDGELIYSSYLGEITQDESVGQSIILDVEEYGITDNTPVFCMVTASENELDVDNNRDFLIVYPADEDELNNYLAKEPENGDILVEKITPVTPETEIKVGETLLLAVEFTPKLATNQNLSWSSSDERVATVDDGGRVTAKSVGDVAIVATSEDGEKTAEFNLKVNPVLTESILLSSEAINMVVGESAALTATVLPDNVTDGTLEWTIDDLSVATIENGSIVAKAKGTAMVTVTSVDNGTSSTCMINVSNPPVSGVEINEEQITLYKNMTFQLEETVLPLLAENKSVLWTSDNEEVAIVTNGKVTAQKAGTATITVTTVDGNHQAVCKVDVLAKAVTDISLSEENIELPIDNVHLLNAIILPEDADNQNLIWSCEDEKIATVDSVTGVVVGISEGTTVITATTEDGGYSAICTVTVTPRPIEIIEVDDIVAGENESELRLGEKMTMSVSILPSNATNQNLIWTSSDKTVAVVDEDGIVTAIGLGNVTITVFTEDGGKSASFELTIKPIVVTGISLNKTELELTIGDSVPLCAKIAPENATNKMVEWNTSDSSIVSVDSRGNIVALSEGEASVTVTAQDGGGAYTSCKVKVVKDVDDSSEDTEKPDNPNDTTEKEPQQEEPRPEKPQPEEPRPEKPQPEEPQPEEPTQSVKVDKIKLTGISKKIALGKKIKLTADLLPVDATDKSVQWISSNTKYATVSTSGVVTITKNKKYAGKTVKITAIANDGSGKKATYKIKIMKDVVKSISLKLREKTLNVGKGVTIKTTIKTSGHQANKKLKWTSSNKKYATVNSKGKVVAKKAGQGKMVKITAKATDGSGKKSTIKLKIK